MTCFNPQKFKLKNGEEIIISSPQESDFENFKTFMRKISEETIFTYQYPGQPEKDKEKTLEFWQSAEQSKKEIVLLAKKEDKIIGLSSLHVKEKHPWREHIGSFGIMVTKEFWGQGLGKKLMDLMGIHAKEKELTCLFAEVRTNNFRGIPFYLNRGYKIQGILHRDAFINGEYVDNYSIYKFLD